MSDHKTMPLQDSGRTTSEPQPFVSINRRREIVSNLAQRALRSTPLVLPEAIAGLSPAPECTGDGDVPGRDGESGKDR